MMVHTLIGILVAISMACCCGAALNSAPQAPDECGAQECDDNSQLQVLKATAGSEPRVHLKNLATNRNLCSNDDWEAGSKCESGRCDWFKLQIAEKTSKDVVTVTTIRTDWHPQSLLDKRDLAFQGSAWDGDKFWDKNRWWGVTFGNISFSKVDNNKDEWVPKDALLAFYTYSSRNAKTPDFLAMRESGDVYLRRMDASTSIRDLPKDSIWTVSVAGSAPSPSEVAMGSVLAPLIVAAGVLTAGGAWVAAGTSSVVLYTAGAATTAAATLTGKVLDGVKTAGHAYFVPL